MKKSFIKLLMLSCLFPFTTFAANMLHPTVIKAKTLYFLSPHSDDVPLTFGGLIQTHHGFTHKKIFYEIFFGLSNWTANDINIQTNQRIDKVTLIRIAEDRSALNELFGGWKRYTYLFNGLLEAPLRNYHGTRTAGGGPGGDFSNFSAAEKYDYQTIYQLVTPILKQKNCAAFVLMANGYHIDHFILREAVIKAAHDLGNQAQCQIYFGEDQPYTGAHTQQVAQQIKTFKQRLQLQTITYPININKKITLFEKNYISQYDPTYIPALRNRTQTLQGGERIYKWNKNNYKNASTAPSCHAHYCQLT